MRSPKLRQPFRMPFRMPCRMMVRSGAIAVLLVTITASLPHSIHTAEVPTANRSSRLVPPLLRAPALLFQPSVQAQPQRVRRPDPEAIAAQIYQQLPELPLENQYLNESGEAAIENTLLTRLIQYHLYIQKRPTNFRLDWKLTLADYLGAFARMREADYPNYGLRQNPMAGDVTAVESLDAQTRDRLVNALYQAFTVADRPPTDRPPEDFTNP